MPRYNCEPREIVNRNGVTFIAYKTRGVWYAHFTGGGDPIQSSETLEGLKFRLQQYSHTDAQRLTSAGSTANQDFPRTSGRSNNLSDVQVREWVQDALRHAGFGFDPPELYLNEAIDITLRQGRGAAIAYISERRDFFLPPPR